MPGIDKRALLERAAAAAHAYDPRVVKVEASLAEEIREILVVTSDGTLARDTQPLVRFGVRVIAEKDGKRQEGSSGGGGRTSMGYFEGKSPEWHAREAARQAVTMLDAQEAPAGQMEVVLAPGDSGILLHEAVGHGLEADFNRKGTSNYSGKRRRRRSRATCAPWSTTRRSSRAAAPSTSTTKATSRARSLLIEKGKLVGYMHDRLSARHFGIKPSGNGRRESFACAPMPRMTNTILLAGPHEPEEILRSVKRGVYAKKFGGGQVDIANGDFVFSLTESYLVEDGKITAPLKGVNLIGNGPDVLRKVTMLGRRRRGERRHLDVRQGRAERPRRRRLPDRQDRCHHRRRHPTRLGSCHLPLTFEKHFSTPASGPWYEGRRVLWARLGHSSS